MRKTLLTMGLLLTTLSFCACGGGETTTKGEAVKTEATTSEKESSKDSETKSKDETAKTTESKKKATKIDFKGESGELLYKKHEVTKDYEGKPALIIYFDYTNTGEENANAMFAFSTKAFQNGVECETAILMDDIKEINNSMKDVKTGTTLSVAYAYKLEDSKTKIELEVSDLISFSSDKATQTLKLK